MVKLINDFLYSLRPINHPINFNIHPMGVREDLNGSGQLDR